MAEEVQVTCRFTTKLPDRLRITDTPFAVPSRLTRYGLSEVVNHLIGHGASSNSHSFLLQRRMLILRLRTAARRETRAFRFRHQWGDTARVAGEVHGPQEPVGGARSFGLDALCAGCRRPG